MVHDNESSNILKNAIDENTKIMQKVPLELLKFYLARYLDPRDLAHLSGVSRRFLCFQDLVHPNYKVVKDQRYILCFF